MKKMRDDEVLRAHSGERICKGEKVDRKFFEKLVGGRGGRSSRQEATDEF